MKTSHWFLLGLILIGSFFMVSCNSGTGTDIDNGSGTIRIESLLPGGPYVELDGDTFTVEVAYTLIDTDQAEISVGFGERDTDGLSSVRIWDSEVVPATATEVIKTLTFYAYLSDWAPNENIFKVFLDPYPTPDSYSPYDTDYDVVVVTPE